MVEGGVQGGQDEAPAQAIVGDPFLVGGARGFGGRISAVGWFGGIWVFENVCDAAVDEDAFDSHLPALEFAGRGIGSEFLSGD